MKFALSLLLIASLCSLPATAADPEPDLPKGGEVERAVRLADGDWIVYRFHSFSDSGARVSRMDAKMTDLRWREQCESLGVPHTKYRHHIDVDIVDQKVKVTS